MKNKLAVVLAFSFLTSFAQATMTRETGGSPPAPLAVVLQGHGKDGVFDLQGRNKALALIAKHVSEDRVVVFAQRPDFQYPDRTYSCIQYRNYNDTVAAAREFAQLLASHPSIEIVSNSSCR